MPRKGLTNEEKQQIIDILKDPSKKHTVRAIAEETGLSKSRVGRFLKEYESGQNGTNEEIVPKPITRTTLDISLNERPPIPKIRTKKTAVKLPNYIEFIEYCEKNKQKHPEVYAKFYKNRKKWKSLIQDFLTVVSDMADSSK